MSKLLLLWILSLSATILLFIDDIAGVDTEDARGVVIANSGMITGKFSWPLLAFFALIFLCTTLLLIFTAFKSMRK